MKNKYQETFSLIRPSDEVIERVMNMTKSDNKKHSVIKPALAMVACLAVLVTGLFAGGAFDKQSDIANVPQKLIQGENTGSKLAPGFVMVVYADEAEEVEIVNDINNLEPNTPFLCQLGAVDIKGKSQKEVDKIVGDIREKFQYIEGENDLGKIHYCMSTITDIYDDAVIYEAYCGNFNFDIDDNTVKNVKEVRVKNDDQKHGYVVIQAMDAYYNDDLTSKNDGINYDKSCYLDNRLSDVDYASLSGKRYQKCYELGKQFDSVKRYFGVNWKINKELYAELNKNPDFDLSQIKDKITFEVEFEDGTISKSVIDIAFTTDGRMYAVNGEYDFIEK